MDDREQFIKGLRELADFYEARPNLPIPSNPLTFDLWPTEKQTPEIVRQFEGAEEIYVGIYYVLRYTFGIIKLDASWSPKNENFTFAAKIIRKNLLDIAGAQE